MAHRRMASLATSAHAPRPPPQEDIRMAEGHEQQEHWVDHTHEVIEHNHRHWHVTHNHNRVAGGFDHLSSQHEHQHDHAELAHSHHPHENFDKEHQGEAHDHDHSTPVRAAAEPVAKKAPEASSSTEPTGPAKKAAARKSPAKKAAGKAAGPR